MSYSWLHTDDVRFERYSVMFIIIVPRQGFLECQVSVHFIQVFTDQTLCLTLTVFFPSFALPPKLFSLITSEVLLT